MKLFPYVYTKIKRDAYFSKLLEECLLFPDRSNEAVVLGQFRFLRYWKYFLTNF